MWKFVIYLNKFYIYNILPIKCGWSIGHSLKWQPKEGKQSQDESNIRPDVDACPLSQDNLWCRLSKNKNANKT